ncbi:MAG: ribonuclease III [Mycobacteriales bacterium]
MAAAGIATTGLPAPRESLLEALDVEIEPVLLERALTHRSYAYENGGVPHNERLEFLGDAVLDLVVTDALYRDHPDLPEGQLAKLRSSVVNSRALAGVAADIGPGGLGSYLRLGRGEEGTGGREKSSILADAMEAILGAVYVDAGLTAATELIHRLFDPLLRESAVLGAGLDWKTSLQELAAAMALGGPDYEIAESGPDHQKSFTAIVRLGGKAFGVGDGTSKKEAEQKAAGVAWAALQESAVGAETRSLRSESLPESLRPETVRPETVRPETLGADTAGPAAGQST